MSDIIPRSIEDYAREHSSTVTDLLDELEKETLETMDNPQMLSGPVEGRLLQMLVRISGAHKVVEIGTFTGYSALMMAEGLPEGGELITCEISEEHAAIARRYFGKSPHGSKIRLELGPAIDTLRKTGDGSVDLIFIDADKISYPMYYEEGIRVLKRGGLMAADNALWGGSVIEPDDDESRAIAEFNDRAMRDDRVENVLLTVRDGLCLIRKK